MSEEIVVKLTGADDYGEWLTAVVAGAGGRGKSPMSITAPHPLFINAEAGTMSIAKDGVYSTEVKSIGQLSAIREILAGGPEVYKAKLGVEKIETVIIDTIDEISRLVIGQRLRDTGQDEFKPGDWVWLGDQMNAIIRGFRSLDMHVIFICHIRDQSDGEGSLFYKLDIMGASAHQLVDAVQVVALVDFEDVAEIDMEGEPISVKKSFLYTRPTEKFPFLKDRSMKLPERMELNFEDDWQRVLDMVFQDTESLTKQEPIVVSSATVTEQAPEKEFVIDHVETVEEKIEAAENIIAAAEQNSKDGGDKMKPELSGSEPREKHSMDLSSFTIGEQIEVGENVPNGFRLMNSGKVMELRSARWVYESNGDKFLSLNQMPDGVIPILNSTINSGLFCQITGVEVEPEQANISRIMGKQILCAPEFERVRKSK